MWKGLHMPRICLVNPPTSFPHDPGGLPTGLLAIGSVLKQKYSNIYILDLDPRARKGFFSKNSSALDKSVQEILNYSPDVVGLTAYCSNLPIVLYLASKIKFNHPNTTIILGGPQVSMTSCDILKNFSEIDIIVKGEGESSILPLIQCLKSNKNLSNVPGISYRHVDQVLQTLPLHLMNNLDDLPFTDYSLINVNEYNSRAEDIGISIEAGRGCPFACTFCSTSVMWQRKYRMKSVGRLYHDMKQASEYFDSTHITLVHDNFTTSAKYVRDFCNYLIDKKSFLKWSCSSRADHIDDDLLELMREAGCYDIFLGIESGSWKIQQLIKKRIKIPVIKETLEKISNTQIESTASFIIGHLEETHDDINQSLELMLDLKLRGVTTTQIHILAAHNGTEVFQKVKNRLYLNKHSSHLAPIEAIAHIEDCQDMVKKFPHIFPSFYQFERDSFDLKTLHFIQNIGFKIINYFFRTLKTFLTISGYSCLETLLFLFDPKKEIESYSSIPNLMGELFSPKLFDVPENVKNYLKELLCYEIILSELSQENKNQYIIKSFSFVMPGDLSENIISQPSFFLFASEKNQVSIYVLDEKQYFYLKQKKEKKNENNSKQQYGNYWDFFKKELSLPSAIRT